MTLYVVNVCASSLEDAAQCLSKGFTSSLTCSSCDLLPRFDLVSLQPDCQSCCQSADDAPDAAAAELYPYATLEVCQ